MSEQKAKPVVVSREQAQTLAEQNPDSSILLTLTVALAEIESLKAERDQWKEQAALDAANAKEHRGLWNDLKVERDKLSDHVDDGYRIANYDASQEALSEAMGELTEARDGIATRDKLIGEALQYVREGRDAEESTARYLRDTGRDEAAKKYQARADHIAALIVKIEALQDTGAAAMSDEAQWNYDEGFADGKAIRYAQVRRDVADKVLANIRREAEKALKAFDECDKTQARMSLAGILLWVTAGEQGGEDLHGESNP